MYIGLFQQNLAGAVAKVLKSCLVRKKKKKKILPKDLIYLDVLLANNLASSGKMSVQKRKRKKKKKTGRGKSPT